MKTYKKVIDKKEVVLPEYKIIIRKDGMATYNPTEEMILEDGWVEYIEPEIVKTEEELLNEEKTILIDQISQYDSSENVNVFYIGENKLWFSKYNRLSLKMRFNAELESGKNTTILWSDGISFDLSLDRAIYILNEIEIYASSCYDKTQQHIANVKKMENIEDVKSYDYKQGYPDVLRF